MKIGDRVAIYSVVCGKFFGTVKDIDGDELIVIPKNCPHFLNGLVRVNKKRCKKLVKKPKFKVGDRVSGNGKYCTVVKYKGVIIEITDSYIVVDTEKGNKNICLSVESCRKIVNKPKFKVGDKVLYTCSGWMGHLQISAGDKMEATIQEFSTRSNEVHIRVGHNIIITTKDCIVKIEEPKIQEQPSLSLMEVERIMKEKMKFGNEKPFDTDLPVMTRDGRKARIICTDRKGDPSCAIIALITNDDGIESICRYCSNGEYLKNNKTYTKQNLINITEPKPLDLHVGGIYRSKNGLICLIASLKYDSPLKFEYSYEAMFFNGQGIGINKDGKGFRQPDDSMDLIEKIGDIRDLSPEIRKYFEGDK